MTGRDGIGCIRQRLRHWRKRRQRPKAAAGVASERRHAARKARLRKQRRFGQRLERSAERMLRRQGLRTLARNYERRTGELDLVMLDGDTLVFVEVRFRGVGAWTSGVGSIDPRKRQRIARTAELYRRDHPEHRLLNVRFDVVSGSKPDCRVRWDWIRNAL
ncbi:MAG: YraN family protein [Gammaproteobacteria bacterium]|nr:YraN family protein [Gammaproteobacteria bacterium]